MLCGRQKHPVISIISDISDINVFAHARLSSVKSHFPEILKIMIIGWT